MYVYSQIPIYEQAEIETVLAKAVQAVETYLGEGIDEAMNKFN